MNKSSLRFRPRFRERYHLETGFSMLEAVVVVGVLLALAVAGFFAYGPITENAKKAKVKSAASEVHTAVLVASSDGDVNTLPKNVIDDWNGSTGKIRVEILKPTTGDTSLNGDFCIQATNVESPYITAREGSCADVTGGGPSDIDGDGIPDSSDPDIDNDGIPNGEDSTPNGGGTPPGDDGSSPPASGGAYKLAGWGGNSSGELGVGNNDEVLEATALGSMKFTKLSAGDRHTCGLSDGKAYCWGDNWAGKLGIGLDDVSSVSTPTAVVTDGVLNGKTITDISAGWNHTCVIADAAAYCWGYNWYTQVNGIADTEWAYSSPVAVTTDGVLAGKALKSIVAAGAHTCALDNSGQAYCWGDTQALGNGVDRDSLTSPVTAPVAVKMNGKTFVKLAGNNQHFCAIDTTSTAYCWGDNIYGKVGLGMADQYNRAEEPTAVAGLPTGSVTSITAGEDHTCATAAGTVYCWGANWSDQLGDGSGIDSGTAVPIGVTGALSGLNMKSVVTSDYATCATTGTAIFCWGDGYVGNGQPYEDTTPTPVQVTGPESGKTVASLSLGANATFILYQD